MPYNIKPLEKIKSQCQSEIDAILEKYAPIFEKAILNQMMKGQTMTIGMGTAFIENKKGECIAEEFSKWVAGIAYCDFLDTGIQLNDLEK